MPLRVAHIGSSEMDLPPQGALEYLPLRRQRAGEDLRSEDRLGRKAVFGLAEGELFAKLDGRRRMAGGSKLTSARICEEYAPGALELDVHQLFCPVCQLWPAASQLASVGEQLAPGWAGGKVATEFRGFGELKEWRGAGRLGTRSSRRGPSNPRGGGILFPASPLGPVAVFCLSALSGLGP